VQIPNPGEQERNDLEWSNPDNWTLPVGFYFSKRDTRWLVPRKNPMLGWTFNLATQKGAWMMLGSFLVPVLILAAVVIVLAFTAAYSRC
jgi:uncharacterized membrane protein